MSTNKFERMRSITKLSMELEEAAEWRRWTDEIPFIKFPADYSVKALPPFGGAIIRYWIKKDGCDQQISVYLDCYNMLGAIPMEPHWEIYPDSEGDNARFKMNDTAVLLEEIEKAFQAYMVKE